MSVGSFLKTALSDAVNYLPIANQIIAANAQQKAQGANVLQIILTDAGAVAQLVPVSTGADITLGIEAVELADTLFEGIKSLVSHPAVTAANASIAAGASTSVAQTGSTVQTAQVAQTAETMKS